MFLPALLNVFGCTISMLMVFTKHAQHTGVSNESSLNLYVICDLLLRCCRGGENADILSGPSLIGEILDHQRPCSQYHVSAMINYTY